MAPPPAPAHATGDRRPRLSDRLAAALRRPVIVVPVLVALSVAIVSAQVFLDRAYEPFRAQTQALYIPSGDVLDRMALSFDAVLADVYWIRALQHYGRTKRSDDEHKRYELLYPLLDITTTLDPRFNIAYRFGAIFLTEGYPNGPGRPDQAVALLQKGVRAMPDRWQYLMDIGFVYYWWLHDYDEAARWFQRASEVPGAAWWLKPLAANTLAVGGNRQDSRWLWQQMYETADDEWMRSEAARRLMQLDALDLIDEHTAIVERVAAEWGRSPTDWEMLVRAGAIAGVPVDPLGFRLQLEASGTVALSPDSPLRPLPVEPPAAHAHRPGEPPGVPAP